MKSADAIEAKLKGRWRAEPDLGTAFRLHLAEFPDSEAGLDFILKELGQLLGIKNMHTRLSGAGPSLKFKGAGVIAFSLSPGECWSFEERYDAFQHFLYENGVLCIEANDAQFSLSPLTQKPQSDFSTAELAVN